jgi:hypothetical protein
MRHILSFCLTLTLAWVAPIFPGEARAVTSADQCISTLKQEFGARMQLHDGTTKPRILYVDVHNKCGDTVNCRYFHAETGRTLGRAAIPYGGGRVELTVDKVNVFGFWQFGKTCTW